MIRIKNKGALGRTVTISLILAVMVVAGIAIFLSRAQIIQTVSETFPDFGKGEPGVNGEEGEVGPEEDKRKSFVSYVKFNFREGIDDQAYFYWDKDTNSPRVSLLINRKYVLTEPSLEDFDWRADPNQVEEFREGGKITPIFKSSVEKIMAQKTIEDFSREIFGVHQLKDVDTYFGRQFTTGDPPFAENPRTTLRKEEVEGWLRT